MLTNPGLAKAQRGQLVFPRGTRFLVTARDANGAVVGEVEPNAAAPRLSVRPGRYFVRGRAEDHLLEGEVTVAAGGTKTISNDDLNRVAYARLVRKGAGVRTVSHSIELAAAARTPLPNGSSPCWGAALGYRLELAALSAGVRVGACRSGFENRAVSANSDEYSGVLELRRAWDLPKLSLFAALNVGLGLTRQSFDAARDVPARLSTSPLGALGAGVLVPLGERYFAGFEALAELQVIRFQESALSKDELRWAFAPRGLLGFGMQL